MGEAQGQVLNVDVAIIGAGPAGLTAGYLLTKAGKNVAIIEKDETYVGGISRTVEGTASFPNRSRSSTCGTRSCPTTSSNARG